MDKIFKENQLFIHDLVATPTGGTVRDIRGHVLNIHERDIQYLDMKQMIDILARFRARLRVTVRLYRRWRADYAREGDEMERAYSAYEGIFIRQQLRDCWRMYVTVNRDYHEMRRVYLASLRQPPHRRAAS